MSIELQATVVGGRLFHNLMASGKNEYWYSCVLANGTRNRWLCPLNVAAVGIKQDVGIATRWLTMRYIIMTLFVALRSYRVGHCSWCNRFVTLVVRW